MIKSWTILINGMLLCVLMTVNQFLKVNVYWIYLQNHVPNTKCNVNKKQARDLVANKVTLEFKVTVCCSSKMHTQAYAHPHTHIIAFPHTRVHACMHRQIRLSPCSALLGKISVPVS